MGRTDKNLTDNGRKAKSLFADYPGQKAFYFTADGLAWFTEQEAKAHAAGLRQDTIETIKR